MPDEGGEQLDEGEVVVRVGPRDPRLYLQARSVDVYAERAQRRNERHHDAAQSDESQIAADGERVIGRDDLIEAQAMDVECAESERCGGRRVSMIASQMCCLLHTCVAERNASQEYGPHEDERICRDSIPDIWSAADVLYDVVPVTLDDIVCTTVSIPSVSYDVHLYSRRAMTMIGTPIAIAISI